jgi:hypothetical protein
MEVAGDSERAEQIGDQDDDEDVEEIQVHVTDWTEVKTSLRANAAPMTPAPPASDRAVRSVDSPR